VNLRSIPQFIVDVATSRSHQELGSEKCLLVVVRQMQLPRREGPSTLGVFYALWKKKIPLAESYSTMSQHLVYRQHSSITFCCSHR